MLEEYLSVIANLDSFVDSILVIDDTARIVYIRQLRPHYTPIDEKKALGKNLFEYFDDVDPDQSTLMAAIKHETVTLGHYSSFVTRYGNTVQTFGNTYPITYNGKLIGAASSIIYPKRISERLNLNLSSYYEINDFDLNKFYTVDDIIGRSPQIIELRNQINKIAYTNSSVLIYGSTGSGKELVAQSIHSASERYEKRFISQNCAAIPATLLESLFFGTTKGSFTDAKDKPGIFESADGGTIFLDEINSMDINLQAKLLRILENHEVTRIGSTTPIKVDVRIIAAINEPPSKCIKDGRLRPDLFYRLGSVTLNIPDLKDRGNDINLLCDYFISYFNRIIPKSIIGVSQDVMKIFRNYSWPGNVREFRNVIEGAFNLCEGPIIVSSELPPYLLASFDDRVDYSSNTFNADTKKIAGNLKENVDYYEKSLIVEAISNNKKLSSAAKQLGISRQTLNQKMKKFSL